MSGKKTSPDRIADIVRKTISVLLPLVKAYISARKLYRHSSSIQNGSAMQDARNAAMTEYENIRHELLHRRETEWKDIMTARELDDLIESEYRTMTKEEEE